MSLVKTDAIKTILYYWHNELFRFILFIIRFEYNSIQMSTNIY
jgi:hypothetical protein